VSTRQSPPASPVLRNSERSGNLRIKAAFSDYDRDQFRSRAFDYIARYFENSLSELQDRNEGIRTRFVRVDAGAFEAAVYAPDGKQRSRCGIWLGTTGSFGGDVGYSNNGLGNRNSYNESLTVSDDSTSLGMRSTGIGFGQEDRAQLLTDEGAAEHLWSLFIEPLQR
jgi:hypothetical protein